MLSHVIGGCQSGGQANNSSEFIVSSGQPTFLSSRYHFTEYRIGKGQVHARGPNYVENKSTQNSTSTVIFNNFHSNIMSNHHWYPQQQPAYNYVAPSNSREIRNKAEKQRRDRLNAFIGELATLVPMVSKSSKRLDKTSILRLTATHLRIYQTLVKNKGTPQMELPPHVDQFVLEQLIADQMGGFLLIMSPTGKIIFVSHTVETLLGHLQTDLMGQSLFTVTASEDHDRLQVFLGCNGEMEQGWRKYFSIRIRRAGPKSETPQYESVRLMGVHRNLAPLESVSSNNCNSTALAASPMSSPASTSTLQTSINTDILIFFVRLCRPQPLVDRLVAASKNEYVTRHLIDGRIIGCDQRISLIAGYMIEEIQGHSAFQYMHRDDVRFVMIALRQMYDKGESRGQSCYRLKSSNGQFIYLKTFGFLEVDDKGIVESFICVNVEVDEKEGLHHIEEMKRRYRAMFTSSLSSLPYQSHIEGNYTSSMTSTWIAQPLPTIPAGKIDLTEDPRTLERAVNELMQNLPLPGSDEIQQEPISTTQPEYSMDVISSSSCSTMTERKPLKTPHLRMQPSGKRPPPLSPENVKRQRLTSVDSEPSKLSPLSNITTPISGVQQSLCKSSKLIEENSTAPTDVMQNQPHHTA